MPVRARAHGNPDGVVHGTVTGFLSIAHGLSKKPQFVTFTRIGAASGAFDVVWDRDLSDDTHIYLLEDSGLPVEFLALCWLE